MPEAPPPYGRQCVTDSVINIERWCIEWVNMKI
nr:MAG TPA: hypothetical protein [Caudoviricetes sp.]